LKKTEESATAEVEEGDGAGGSDEEDDLDQGARSAPSLPCEYTDVMFTLDELAALDSANVIEGGRRTRGVRVDYTKLKVDEEDEEEDEEEEGEDQGAVVDEGEEEGKSGEADEEEDTTEKVVASKEKNGYEEDEE
jgi:hypothetical protein